jgi:hypothetical protein
MHAVIMRALHSGTAIGRAPRGLDELRATLEREHARLPEAHWDLLKVSDGVTAYGGYFRILGAEELMDWNAVDAWKFAWPPGLESYFCFAETAWGDQYAYRRADMDGPGELPVYFLESIMLAPEKLTETFVAFLENDSFEIHIVRTTISWSRRARSSVIWTARATSSPCHRR